MRFSSASITSLFQFSSAKQQANIDTTVTMAWGSRGNGKAPCTERPPATLQPTQASLPLPTSPSDITMELDTSESLASTGPTIVKTSISDSQDTQGLENPSISDGEKPPTQATEDREHSAKSKKRSRRKAKKTKAQRPGSPTPAVSADILPPDNRGPTPAPATSRRGSPITSPKPNVGFSPVPPPLAFAEPTKAEETLRQENERLRRELEEAKCLAKGLKEAHFQLEEEVETWKQKCEGFSETVKELRTEVEGMINSHISMFFDQMEEEKEGGGKNKGGRKEEKEVKERKDEEVEEEKREDKGREENGWSKKERKAKGKGKDKEEKEGKDGKEGEAELKARQEKNLQGSSEQIKSYRQRKKEEERRGKKWWTRFHMKLPRISWRRVVMRLFLLLSSLVLIVAIDEIEAYSRAHARRVERLELNESRTIQLAKAVAQFAADLLPEPIKCILYHSFLNDGWDLDPPY